MQKTGELGLVRVARAGRIDAILWPEIPGQESDGTVQKIWSPRSVHHPLPNSDRFFGFRPAAVAGAAVGAHVAAFGPHARRPESVVTGCAGITRIV